MSDYGASLRDACGFDASAGPRGDVLDNTKHVGSCSLISAGPIVAVVAVGLVLKCLLCPARLRQTYSGSEDAPELEVLACAGGGGTGRRVDSYATRSGRLTSAAVAPAARGGGKAARPKGRARRGEELQPVLPVCGWRRDGDD